MHCTSHRLTSCLRNCFLICTSTAILTADQNGRNPYSLFLYKYRDWLSSRSKTQASGWCCMRSTFLQIVCRYVAPPGECHYWLLQHSITLRRVFFIALYLRNACIIFTPKVPVCQISYLS